MATRTQSRSNTKGRPPGDEIQIRNVWPTTFFFRKWKDHAREATSIIEYLYQLKGEADQNIASRVAPKAKSEQGLFESEFDLFQESHNGIEKLGEFIRETIQQVVSRLHNHQILPDQIDVEIADGWFHITNDGGFHDTHGHQHCSWCGIYYLQLGDSGEAHSQQDGAPNGGNRFYSPFVIGGHYVDLGNRYLTSTYLDPPIEDGMLLLFPSYLQHSALPYKGSQDRIVIAFNSRSNRLESA